MAHEPGLEAREAVRIVADVLDALPVLMDQAIAGPDRSVAAGVPDGSIADVPLDVGWERSADRLDPFRGGVADVADDGAGVDG